MEPLSNPSKSAEQQPQTRKKTRKKEEEKERRGVFKQLQNYNYE